MTYRRCLAVLLAAPLLLAACSQRPSTALQREQLFSLSIGKMEDEVDLFQLPGVPYTQKTRIYWRNGLFYVANGNSHKVMEFSSYGDLLSLYYNPDENPEPTVLQTSHSEETVANRRAFAYPFNQVGELAVTSDKMLLVEDRLPPERRRVDEDLGAMLDRVIRRFDRDGTPVDYLGQEGVGGTPLPHVQDLFVTNHDEIVVVSRSMTSWIAYWFNPKGYSLFTVVFDSGAFPGPEDEEMVANLERIVPDLDERVLYLKLDYYRQSIDTSTMTQAGIEYVYSRIYAFDHRTEQYGAYVELPHNVQRQGAPGIFQSSRREHLYELVGVAGGGLFFLLSPTEANRYELLIVDASGRVVRRRTISVEDSELVYKTYHVTPEGILMALLGGEHQASVVWWRSDRLVATEE